jgi:hypothetical protein
MAGKTEIENVIPQPENTTPETPKTPKSNAKPDTTPKPWSCTKGEALGILKANRLGDYTDEQKLVIRAEANSGKENGTNRERDFSNEKWNDKQTLRDTTQVVTKLDTKGKNNVSTVEARCIMCGSFPRNGKIVEWGMFSVNGQRVYGIFSAVNKETALPVGFNPTKHDNQVIILDEMYSIKVATVTEAKWIQVNLTLRDSSGNKMKENGKNATLKYCELLEEGDMVAVEFVGAPQIRAFEADLVPGGSATSKSIQLLHVECDL